MCQCVYLLQELLLCLCLCRDTVLDMLHDCGSSCIGLPFGTERGACVHCLLLIITDVTRLLCLFARILGLALPLSSHSRGRHIMTYIRF